MTVQIGQAAPDFEVQAYDRTKDGTDDQFSTIKLADLNGNMDLPVLLPARFYIRLPDGNRCFQ